MGLAVRPGFADVSLDSQACFTAVMNALSRPGLAQPFRSGLDAPPPLTANAAAIVLTLADFETTLWLDPAIAGASEAARYLAFHAGARLTESPAAADFALVLDPASMPPLSAFAPGSQEYPDRSTTVILQVERFTEAMRFSGPGVRGHLDFGVEPAPADFAEQLAANRALFPRGVDMVFATAEAVAALPRSARLTGG